ncbi:hypothetical protein FGO68_gene14551 [Halteria grandinella]|uniref:Protein kinase domain-containing protein n=1 Tax=Halteria grandinella TaxID=5974 RepID=A0A8J8P385_HALGN|nr:hypothetical protein FGO68_gene14551 [Halteria grandinella]
MNNANNDNKSSSPERKGKFLDNDAKQQQQLFSGAVQFTQLDKVKAQQPSRNQRRNGHGSKNHASQDEVAKGKQNSSQIENFIQNAYHLQQASIAKDSRHLNLKGILFQLQQLEPQKLKEQEINYKLDIEWIKNVLIKIVDKPSQLEKKLLKYSQVACYEGQLILSSSFELTQQRAIEGTSTVQQQQNQSNLLNMANLFSQKGIEINQLDGASNAQISNLTANNQQSKALNITPSNQSLTRHSKNQGSKQLLLNPLIGENNKSENLARESPAATTLQQHRGSIFAGVSEDKCLGATGNDGQNSNQFVNSQKQLKIPQQNPQSSREQISPDNISPLQQDPAQLLQWLDITLWEVIFIHPQVESKRRLSQSQQRQIIGNLIPKFVTDSDITTFKIKMRPYQFSDQWDCFMELIFATESDFTNMKELLCAHVLIVYPPLEEDYVFISQIGTGSQATVDHYQNRVPRRNGANPSQNINSSATPNNKTLVSGINPLESQSQAELQFQSQHAAAAKNNQAELESFAVKKYTINASDPNINLESERDMIFNEICFIRQLRICENIVQIDRVYSTRSLESGHRQICLVMKYAKYGSLLKHILRNQKFTEAQIRTIMEQLLLAVDLMHRSNIIHRDIKPDNILLMERENLKICITDLGLACRADDVKETNLKCGTPGYVGPEILKGLPFTQKTDIFSVGSFMYNLLTSNSLYQGRNAQEMLFANKYQNPYSTVQLKVTGVSADCKHLLLWMLQTTPESRPTAEQCINHKWFQQDREALQSSLFINKNPQLIASYFNNPINEINPQEFVSFIIAPNYFQNLQCLPSQTPANLNLLNNSNMHQNTSSVSGQLAIVTNKRNNSVFAVGGSGFGGGANQMLQNTLGNNLGASRILNPAVSPSGFGGRQGSVFAYQDSKSRKGSVVNVKFCYNQIISQGRQMSINGDIPQFAAPSLLNQTKRIESNQASAQALQSASNAGLFVPVTGQQERPSSRNQVSDIKEELTSKGRGLTSQQNASNSQIMMAPQDSSSGERVNPSLVQQEPLYKPAQQAVSGPREEQKRTSAFGKYIFKRKQSEEVEVAPALPPVENDNPVKQEFSDPPQPGIPPPYQENQGISLKQDINKQQKEDEECLDLKIPTVLKVEEKKLPGPQKQQEKPLATAGQCEESVPLLHREEKKDFIKPKVDSLCVPGQQQASQPLNQGDYLGKETPVQFPSEVPESVPQEDIDLSEGNDFEEHSSPKCATRGLMQQQQMDGRVLNKQTFERRLSNRQQINDLKNMEISMHIKNKDPIKVQRRFFLLM